MSQTSNVKRGASKVQLLISNLQFEETDAGVLLRVSGLRKHFPIQKGFMRRTAGYVRAVDGVDFYIKAGETFGLVGESGCGKTTTGRCVLRAIEPTVGQVLFRDQQMGEVDVTQLSEAQLRIFRCHTAMIFQDPYSSLNPRMTLLDIVGEPLLNNGVRGQERRDRVEQLLQLVGLRPEYIVRYPHAFSGGQRQRVGIARALALNPLVLTDSVVGLL